MRIETTAENIARDIKEGRFPERSKPQMVNDDKEALKRAMDWAARTPLKMGSKEFEDGIKQLLRGETQSS